MDKSWFAQASARASKMLPKSEHELPRWRSPSPMTASIIPPPIVASMYLAPDVSPGLTSRSVVLEETSPYQQRQGELEADLQFLLDAQAEGLTAGFGGGLRDDHTSTGSTTPTARSVRSSSTPRAERPVRRKLGLNSARRGIYNSINALAVLKLEESGSLQAEIDDKDDTLERIDGWQEKRQRLHEVTQGIEDNEDTIRSQRLRQDADVLQIEINELELRLSDIKSRHRRIVRQAEAVENSVQAKLASYTSSLSMLEADVNKFLSRTPRRERSSSRPTSSDGKSSMWQLPPKRRTLEMAKEHWQQEREALQQELAAIKVERQALVEGGKVWRDAVVEVSDFEKKLKNDIAASSLSSSHAAWEDPPQQHDLTERTRALLAQTEAVITSLDSKLEVARSKGWKLLMASVGAELEAFKQGKAVLEHALTAANEPAMGEDGEQFHDDVQAQDHGQEIRELDEAFDASRRHGLSNGTSDTEDDPDPELLVSHQDTDTE